jgi:peroxiredoxin
MRAKQIQQLWLLAGILLAGLWTSTVMADAAPPPDPMARSLKASSAAAAWAELQSSTRPPPSPKGWADTPPTEKEKTKYYLPYIGALVDRFKDFYTRFPGDSNAPRDAGRCLVMDFYTRFPGDSNAADAKLNEYKYLTLMAKWGDTSQQSRLDTVKKALLKDPDISSDQHFEILLDIAQNSPPEQARPLLQEIANGNASDKVKAQAEEATAQLKSVGLVGQPINVAFTAVDGRSVDLSKLKGKVVLLDFWATWCPPCRGEVPNVKKTYDRFHDQGFEIVGVSLDQDKDKLTQFVAENKMAWPQYFDGLGWQNKYAQQFGINSIPAMWLIDKQGKLRDVNGREDLSGGVQKLLAE